MLENASIICVANDWQGDPTSKKHIMRILARKNRILWVNSIGLRRPTASRSDLGRLATKLRRGLSACREVEPGIFVMNPLVLPLFGVKWADRLNSAILAVWLRWLCRRLGFERRILWSFLPCVSRLVGRLGEQMVIYHCVDENSAFSGVPRETLIRMEQDLVKRSDLVLASSAQLCRERQGLNRNTHFVSHGVDVAHFSRALDPGTQVPEELRGLPRPMVGFFGLIADWVDLDLIRAVAVARPSWSIVLVGKVATDLQPLRGLPNVHVLGQKEYSTLPAFCRAFDVGIIPFRTNELTVRANPLKLREYLAAGLPVVSSPLPEVARYAGLVHLGDGAEAFTAAIETALGERTEAWAKRRVEAMRAESWEGRVEQMSEIIDERLASRVAVAERRVSHGDERLASRVGVAERRVSHGDERLASRVAVVERRVSHGRPLEVHAP
jgi:glycosyltransferase involved in cell wall biosynthesis